MIVTTLPGAPPAGVKLDTDSVGLNSLGLSAVSTGVVTEMSPTSAPLGTVASIDVGESSVKVALTPSKCTALVEPNAVPVIVTLLPVIPDAGVKDVIFGMSEMTVAVCVETAGEPAPVALVAISCTRSVEPTAVEVSVYVAPVAPAIDEQLEPEVLHSAHWSV